jgi:hypothetical protein
MTGNLLRLHWSEICGDCRMYWGKLSEEDLVQIDGQFDRFVGALRRHYGFSRLKAEEELEDFLFRYSDGPPAWPLASRGLAEVSP